jgi:peptidoglycan/LPS O-acetylase OafA/YrhL
MSGHSHFDNLAGIRGLAALIVLIAHIVQIQFLRFIGLGTPVQKFFSYASEYAVVVFFILSGYLITYTLEANIKRNGKLRLGEFAAARFARLYPPLFYAICVSVVIFFVLDIFKLPGRGSTLILPGDLYSARELIHLRMGEVGGALGMVQGMLEINGPLWSLYIEAKLYVLFACLLALVTGRRSFFSRTILGLLFFVVLWSGFKYNPGFANYGTIWLTGALAYYVFSHAAVSEWRRRAALCSGLILIAIGLEMWQVLSSESGAMSIALNVLVASVIAWLLFRFQIRVPLDRRLADCSYSLYATHFPILLLAQSLLISTGSRSVAASVATAIASMVVVTAIALIGGYIEAQKSSVQKWLLRMWPHKREFE